MPPKLLDIRVEIPAAVAPDGDVDDAVVVDAGADNPAERTTFVHFYATAMAVLLERAFAKKVPPGCAQTNKPLTLAANS